MKLRPPSFFLVLALLLAGGAGFLLRRATVENVEPSLARPSTEPPSASAVTADDSQKPSMEPPATPDDLFEEALKLRKEQNRLGEALAFYRWLHALDATAIERQIEKWRTGEGSGNSAWFDTTVIRFAELAPDRASEMLGKERSVRRALRTGKLSRDSKAALADCPDDLRRFCRMFIAARHPSFDLEWARSFDVPLAWFVQVWVYRGFDVREVLENADDLDPELLAKLMKVNAREPGPLYFDSDAFRRPLEQLKLAQESGTLFTPSSGGSQGNIFHAALSERPEATVDWLMSLDSEERKKALEGIYTSSLGGPVNTRGWLDLYLGLPREELPGIMRLSMYLRRELTRPQSTLKWFEDMAARNHFEMGDDEKRDRAIFHQNATKFGDLLAHYGVESALARAREIKDEDLRQAVLGGIATTTAKFDLEAARKLLPELKGEQRTSLEATILHQDLKALPMETVVQSLRALPDRQQSAVASKLVFDRDLPIGDRGAMIDQLHEDDPDLFNYSIQLVYDWAWTSPRDAAVWLMQYSDEPRFADRTEDLVETWARHDIEGAANWVIDLEPGQARDGAVEAITEQAVHRDPHSALEWAALVTDPKKRLRFLQEAAILIDVNATETNEAQAAVEALDLSPDDRAVVLKHLED